MNTLEHAVRLLADKLINYYAKTCKKYGDTVIKEEHEALCVGLLYLCACPHDYLHMSMADIHFVLNGVNYVWVSRDFYDERLDTCTFCICVGIKKEGTRSRHHTYRIRVSDNTFYIGYNTLVRAKRNRILHALYDRLRDKKYWGK